MAAPTLITELSQTAGSNGPAGSVSPIELDNYDRAHASFIAQLRDGKGHAATASVASATTTDIGAANSLSVEITGTTTITGFGTAYSGPRLLRFAGALILTHSASLALPGAANITTAAGDTCIASPNLAASGWNVYAYQRAAVFGGPTFSAYLASSGGSVSDSTFTKCLFDTELWDSDSNFASSRFTPTVAGYYQINAAVQLASPAPGFLTIYKYTAATTTLAEYKRGAWVAVAAGAQDFSVSGLVKLDIGDYVEIYIRHTFGSALVPQGGATVSWFDGHFVRGL